MIPSAIQTFVLIVSTHLAIPGYGSLAECEAAKEVLVSNFKKEHRIWTYPVCIPGPVERR